jgi:DNA-binding beta-propeller fold protein YncE
MWDAVAGQQTLTLEGGGCVAFSPDGRRIAANSGDKVRVWDAATGRDTLTFPKNAAKGDDFSLAFSPDGRCILSEGMRGALKAWDAATGRETLAHEGQPHDFVMAAAFSPDGSRVASAAWDSNLPIRVQDVTTGRETLTLKGHMGHVRCIAFSPDGRRIASASYDDGTVRVWDAATGREMLVLRRPGILGFDGVAISPDGSRLASAAQDGMVTVWDAATGQIALNLKGHAGAVSGVAFSPDGQRIASAGRDETVRVWDVVTGQEVLTLKGPKGAMTAVVFSPDGSRLAARREDGRLHVWDARPVDPEAIPSPISSADPPPASLGPPRLVREAIPAAALPPATAIPAPAPHAAKPAASGPSSIDNLLRIRAALHEFAKSHDYHFPADIRDRDGKPLLSWRVGLLPFLDQQVLFDSIRLDEPWDGPHNKILLDKMPPVFAMPDSSAGPGMTFYRGFSGKRALFDPAVKEGVPMDSITDGLSSTIAVVEAREAVTWTRPGSDLAFDDEAKPERLQILLGELGGHFPGGFRATFCDGAVRSVRSTVNLRVLRGLITRDGGEKITIRPDSILPSGPPPKIPSFTDFDENSGLKQREKR